MFIKIINRNAENTIISNLFDKQKTKNGGNVDLTGYSVNILQCYSKIINLCSVLAYLYFLWSGESTKFLHITQNKSKYDSLVNKETYYDGFTMMAQLRKNHYHINGQ